MAINTSVAVKFTPLKDGRGTFTTKLVSTQARRILGAGGKSIMKGLAHHMTKVVTHKTANKWHGARSNILKFSSSGDGFLYKSEGKGKQQASLNFFFKSDNAGMIGIRNIPFINRLYGDVDIKAKKGYMWIPISRETYTADRSSKKIYEVRNKYNSGGWRTFSIDSKTKGNKVFVAQKGRDKRTRRLLYALAKNVKIPAQRNLVPPHGFMVQWGKAGMLAEIRRLTASGAK